VRETAHSGTTHPNNECVTATTHWQRVVSDACRRSPDRACDGMT